MICVYNMFILLSLHYFFLFFFSFLYLHNGYYIIFLYFCSVINSKSYKSMKEKRYFLKSRFREDLSILHQEIGYILSLDDEDGFKFNEFSPLAPVFFRVFSRYFYLRSISSWFK